MNYISIDLEFNQPERGLKSPTWKGKCIINEIIEIGASLLDSNLKFKRGFKIYIKPCVHPVINKHVLKLLGFENQDYINLNGTRIHHAIELFKYFVGEEKFAFLTWGNDDIKILQHNCRINKIDFNWMKTRIIDVQKCYMSYCNITVQPSLEKALAELNIPFEKDKMHQAFIDSLNAAKVAQKLGKKVIDNTKIPLKVLKSPIELLEGSKQTVHCPRCGKFTKKLLVSDVRQTGQNGNHFRLNKLSKCKLCDCIINTEYLMNSFTKEIITKQRYAKSSNAPAIECFKGFFNKDISKSI
jgi:inhibitor of KinA sporulation pathway (predicted exonuclease)